MIDPQTILDIQMTPSQALGGSLSVSAFTDFGTILRASWAASGMGGSIPTWSAHGTAVCSVKPDGSPSTEINAQGRIESVAKWLIVFPAYTDVTEPDRITCLGATYDVVAVEAPQTLETSRTCHCVRAV